MRLPHLAARVFNAPLMIQPDKAEAILSVLMPHFAGEVEGPPKPSADIEGTDRKPYKLTRGGIALVPVMGTLVRRGSYLDAVSGLQSYDSILGQVRTAARDDDVKGVLLQVDSPGGEVAGLFDLADEIAALARIKPVYAAADDSAFSAAYAIASSAERLFVTRSGGVGSVGVIAMHVDQSGADAKAGLVYTPVYAGAHKADLNCHAPLSGDAKARLQAEVDRLYGMFTAHVATARGLPLAKVQATQAGLFFGDEGVTAGLADEVGTIDDAAAALAARIGSARTGTPRGRAAAGPTTSEISMEATALHEEPLQGAETVPATPTSVAETPASEPQAAAPEAPAVAETEIPTAAEAPAPAAEGPEAAGRGRPRGPAEPADRGPPRPRPRASTSRRSARRPRPRPRPTSPPAPPRSSTSARSPASRTSPAR
jgi:signal peptide peptidase SppA